MAISRTSKIGIAVLVFLVLIQFIRPAENNATADSPADIRMHYPPPPDVQGLLNIACYDCHSNHTRYPWYSKIQPVYWWMTYHVNQGKSHLNFSEFAGYPASKIPKMLKHISKLVKSRGMPISSYLWEHHDARLTGTQNNRIAFWADSLAATLAVKASK
jgi:hypothetical protein